MVCSSATYMSMACLSYGINTRGLCGSFGDMFTSGSGCFSAARSLQPCGLYGAGLGKLSALSVRFPSQMLSAERHCMRALHDPHHGQVVRAQVVNHLHDVLFSISDATTEAAMSAASSVVKDAATAAGDASAATGGAASTFVKQSDWFSWLADILEGSLKLLENGLSAVHLPYAYGFSIILLTVLVKLATFPLTKKQVESTMAMQNLQPKIKAIQTTYAGNQERIQLETARLYKQAGVNPLAGCLPTLATLPVWIGLYRALSNVANEGVLTEGFFWIPSLAGPTSIAARSTGSGTSWLLPFVDGAPPLGWADTAAYLVLPVLLVISQAVSMQLMQPQTTDPTQKQTQAILKFLPLMIGYFSLSVPSGLSLYWLTNNLLSTAQQVYLKQLGGAQPGSGADGVGIIDAGQARRSGTLIATEEEKERERQRGEKFRQLKEQEALKKASARKSAEEASKAAAARAQEQLAEQQKVAASSSDSLLLSGEEQHVDDAEVGGDCGEVRAALFSASSSAT
eukprot:jgi/Mesen1/3072/ME000181S02147